MAKDLEKLAAQSQRLRDLKEQGGRGITFRKIGDASGVSDRQAQRWFKGESDPEPDHLKALARYFGTTPDYIEYGRERKRSRTPDLRLVREDPATAQLNRMEAKLDRLLAAAGLSAPEEPPEDLAASGRPPGPPPKKPGEPPIEETPPEPETDEEAGDSDIG